MAHLHHPILRGSAHLRRCAIGALCMFALSMSAISHAEGIVVHAPDVDASGLSALTEPDGDLNPYRDDPLAIKVGHAAFNQSCARCHGIDADASRSPAPDLRRIGRGCGRVRDAALKLRCQSDADYYFRSTVEKGKTKLGVQHMPPWKGVLSTELIWAIRSFVESTQSPKR